MSLKNQCIFVVFSFQIAFKLEAMFFERQYAQKWRLRQAFRDSFFFLVGRRQGVCLQKKHLNNFKHHTYKNERPRKISMNMVN